ncbi:MAG: hypothetical protein M3373_00665 [Gemmatimonadota bacterium]|nr:hypothetical protein [Gemmatimonadota bacterium]
MMRFLAVLPPAVWITLAATSCTVGVWTLGTSAAAAQGWNDLRTRELVRRATERRAIQLADTALRDYRATARGYVAFLAQFAGEAGEFTEPPQIVKADELALEVYWRAPNLSKQRIVGRRDSLLLPTDIQYHRDHLGIVQNNFPATIRIGEGDEVSDVPHPLSPAGLDQYDFTISDSLSIRLPDRAIEVYEIRVRPKDDTQPRIIGAIYLDRASGDVVRMAFNFTRAAFLDKQLEDLSIVLENALVGGRFWLPRRQEVEIRRAATWLDYPVRGIIRGRWEIHGYEVNVGLDPRLFAGPEIVFAPRRVLEQHRWEGRILDSLPPDVRAVTADEVRRVQEEARELVRAQALAGSTGSSLSARRISDFVRVNRVEGLAVGAGVVRRFGSGVSVGASGRWGFDDEEAKGRVDLTLRRASGIGASLYAERGYRDAGDVTETSLVRNSIAAQEFGSDYTQPYDVRAAGLSVALGRRLGFRWRVEGTYERQSQLEVNARPWNGSYAPTIGAWPIDVRRLSLWLDRPTALAPYGLELRVAGELRGALLRERDTALAGLRPKLARGFLTARAERPVGPHRLVLESTIAGVVAERDPPPQSLVYLGGPVSGPGYDYHAFAAELGATQRIEWRAPVPFVSIPIGRYGRAPAAATIAAFGHGVYVSRVAPAGAARRKDGRVGGAGWYPSVGVGALFFFDVLRLDVARGLRGGRWTFSLDVAREFWPIL